MLIDLHVHSHLTKGCDLDPRAVLDRAASLGLDGVAFTETNTQDGCDELFALQAKTELRIFAGLELVTDKGQFLCFFARPELVPEPVQLWGSNREKPWSVAEVLPKVLSLGAVVVAARPYDRDVPTPALDSVLSLTGLSAIEGFNARVRQPANDLAVEAAEKMGLPSVGGSDAKLTLDEVGRGATFFRDAPRSQAELVTALRGKAYWPVMVGELPRLGRPGEARETERSKRKGRFRGRFR
jgi:predicted metal-dependent phosphoesterase TrpH